MSTTTTNDERFPFLKLPRELKDMVYSYCLDVKRVRQELGLQHGYQLRRAAFFNDEDRFLRLQHAKPRLKLDIHGESYRQTRTGVLIRHDIPNSALIDCCGVMQESCEEFARWPANITIHGLAEHIDPEVLDMGPCIPIRMIVTHAMPLRTALSRTASSMRGRLPALCKFIAAQNKRLKYVSRREVKLVIDVISEEHTLAKLWNNKDHLTKFYDEARFTPQFWYALSEQLREHGRMTCEIEIVLWLPKQGTGDKKPAKGSGQSSKHVENKTENYCEPHVENENKDHCERAGIWRYTLKEDGKFEGRLMLGKSFDW
jgi:hypothetical protein